MVTPNFDDVEARLFELFDAALEESPHPPPHVEEFLGPEVDSGVPSDVVSTWRGRLQAEITAGIAFGDLIRLRREALGYSIPDLCEQCGWTLDRLVELEANVLDLDEVAVSSLASVLAALHITKIAPIETPLRILWQERAVTNGQRQRPIVVRGSRMAIVIDRERTVPCAPSSVDHETAARDADRYLKDVQYALDSLETRQG